MKKFLLIIFIMTGFLSAYNCENRLFSLNNNLDQNDRMSINEFLGYLVTQTCHISIVTDDKESQKLLSEKMPFIRTSNVTLEDILNLLITKRGYFYTLKDNILTISYYKTKIYKLNFLLSSRSGSSTLNATSSQVSNSYSFDFWSQIQKNITEILNNTGGEAKSPIVDKNVGLITVTGTRRQLEEVDKYISTLIKRLTKEVLIDVKIYEVELSNQHTTGIDWSQFVININGDNKPLRATQILGRSSIFSAATFSVNGLLNFLANYGNVNSISNPKIVTLNNQKAIISVGDTIYYKYASSVTKDANGNPNTQYTIDSRFVGIVLDITPQIADDGTIILSISPTISAFKDPSQLTNPNRDMPPDTQDNTMLSIVKLKDNQVLVLGGLITDRNALQANGIPVLKEIPLIKYLFSSKYKVSSKRELVFVVIPHIIDLKKKVTLRDLDFGK